MIAVIPALDRVSGFRPALAQETMMDLGITSEIRRVPDIRHRIRRLRWFKESFRHGADFIGERYGLTFGIDDSRLTATFLNWAEAFSAQKSYAKFDRRDFMTFAAGLLLREFIRAQPVTAQGSAVGTRVPDAAGPIVQAWPEGFLYTNYCLCVLAAVFEQEGMSLTVPPLVDDLRTWWSYRENVGEDPSLAIAFLDLFTGNEPNWAMPDSVATRDAIKRAVSAQAQQTKAQIAAH